jgi:hypothetical protein
MLSIQARSVSMKRPGTMLPSVVRGSVVALLGALVACSATNGSDGALDAEGSLEEANHALEEAPPLPSPRALVSGLDLECYKSAGPPPVEELGIRQLNPVLKGTLPNQRIKLGEMLQTCLPVSKNQQTPPASVLPLISQIDLACYRAEADPVDVPVNLRHLNPVLRDLPDMNVRLKELKRFCSPVRKNFADIPDKVHRFVRHVDLACYEFEELTPPANVNLWLSHLNPVVREFGFPDRLVHVERANQLCVPVGKNQQPIPEDVLRAVEWIDLVQYELDPITPPPPPFLLWLSQLNPLFAGAPPTPTILEEPRTLMVPVAKNNQLPPI